MSCRFRVSGFFWFFGFCFEGGGVEWCALTAFGVFEL
jgi:hypothetical protein